MPIHSDVLAYCDCGWERRFDSEWRAQAALREHYETPCEAHPAANLEKVNP